jgi:hypothetical protein
MKSLKTAEAGRVGRVEKSLLNVKTAERYEFEATEET